MNSCTDTNTHTHKQACAKTHRHVYAHTPHMHTHVPLIHTQTALSPIFVESHLSFLSALWLISISIITPIHLKQTLTKLSAWQTWGGAWKGIKQRQQPTEVPMCALTGVKRSLGYQEGTLVTGGAVAFGDGQELNGGAGDRQTVPEGWWGGGVSLASAGRRHTRDDGEGAGTLG